MTNGNPRMAINAEFPPARCAIAANNVNNKDKLIPPEKTISKNLPTFNVGFPSNKIKMR